MVSHPQTCSNERLYSTFLHFYRFQNYSADPDRQLFPCKATTPLRPPAPAGATVTGHSDTRGQKLLLQPQEMRRLYKKKESAGAGLCPPLEEPSAEPGTVPGGTACKRAGRNNGRDEVLFIKTSSLDNFYKGVMSGLG
ncbi:hypothetical protein ATANTOWER_017867, partial [Ataeniobius toweri]|nr:hypothetical protein [Ataeniobius toweri]